MHHPHHHDTRLAASLWSVAPTDRNAIAQGLAADGVTRFHWDFSDGVFAAAGGTTAAQAAQITALTGAAAEAHLMVTDPLDHIEQWLPFCDVVTVHVEAHRWEDAVLAIAQAGRTPAVAVSPGGTLPAPLPASVEAVLAMSVIPGQGGSTFDPAALDVVAATPASLLSGVDGGVTTDIAPRLLEAGVRWIVCGTDLLAAESVDYWRSAAGLDES